jgi:MFS family permease
MAHPDTTAQPQTAPHAGGLFDPVRPSHRWWVSAALNEHLSWRMVFFLSVVPGLVCIVLVWFILPNVREGVQHSFDLPGLLTMSVFRVSLLVDMSREQREGWDTPFIQWFLLLPV